MKFPRFYSAVFIFAILAFAVAACKDDSDPDPIDPTPIDPAPIGIANQIAGTWEGTCYFHGEDYDHITQTITHTYDTTRNSTLTITALSDSTANVHGLCCSFPNKIYLLLTPGDSIVQSSYHVGNYYWWMEVNVNSKKITTKVSYSHEPYAPTADRARGEFFY